MAVDHTALAQASIMLGQYLIDHADDLGGQLATVAPALSGFAGFAMLFIRSAPGLELVTFVAQFVMKLLAARKEG